ncbi:MAG: HIT family protein [Flavobacteriales bacterium]|nr:HIT family protein [Flavobacteriales bacterium]
MSTIFQRIINKEIPAYIIEEDEFHLAFLDINPLKEGHTLVIPKKEVDYIFDIENQDLEKLILFAKKVAIKIKSKIPCTKVGMTVIGLEVPHAHIHLIPMNSISDMNFSKEKLNLSKERMLELHEFINS